MQFRADALNRAAFSFEHLEALQDLNMVVKAPDSRK
jgi:hypothetical protein